MTPKDICNICKVNTPDIALSIKGPKICCYKCWKSDDEFIQQLKSHLFEIGAIPIRLVSKSDLKKLYPSD